MPECVIETKHEDGSHVTDPLFALRQPTHFPQIQAPSPPSTGAIRSHKQTTSAADLFDVYVQFTIPVSADTVNLVSGDSLAGSIESDLRSDVNEVSEQARTALLGVAAAIAPLMYSVPEVRHAAFADEEGGALLVFHSRPSKRQLSFEATRLGKMSAITIDSELRRQEYEMRPDNVRLIRKLFAWLRITT
jgi:hypothetical protein